MKTAALAFAAALAAPAVALAIPPAGAPAPLFQTRDADGQPVSLAALKGKVVVLEWTNQGCPFVRHAYDSGVMQRLQARARREGVVWISVISSGPGQQGHLAPAEVAAWKAREHALPSHVVLDPSGALGRLYDARTTPDIYVIDPAGRLAYAGAFDDHVSTNPADARTAHNYVEAALTAVEAGRTPQPSMTKSYGCSVKYAGVRE